MEMRTGLTVDDLPTLPDGGRRYELFAGVPKEEPPAHVGHGFVLANVGGVLREYRDDRMPGVVLVRVHCRIERDPDTVRIADAAFLSMDRWERADPRAPALEGAPDLAVEVVSMMDTYGGVHDKALAWLRAGSRMVWVVQPLYKVVHVLLPRGEAHVLTVDATLADGGVLPGFGVPVRSLFE